MHGGDLIRWTRNDHAGGRINAEVGRVVAIDRNRHHAEVLVNGALHRLDLDRQGHWELAYATTIHAAQGRTTDRVLLHLNTSKPHLISHEGWYVGISRAQNELRIFTDNIQRLPDQIRTSLQQESAVGAVAREERSHVEHSRRQPETVPQPRVEKVARIEEHEQRAALQRENVQRLVERQRALRAAEQREEHRVDAGERKRDPQREELVRSQDERSQKRPKDRQQKKERQYFGFGFAR